MRTRTVLLFLLFLSLLFGTASAESDGWNSFRADTDSEYLNLDDVEKIRDWDAFYAFLDRFPLLKQVDMFNVPVDYIRAEDLHARFPSVEFGLTMRFSEHTVRTDATAFSTQHVHSAQWHNVQQLAVLRFCRNMYALDIGHNNFTDLSFLREMPQLRVLILAVGPATDLSPLAELEHLEYLELFWNRITDISPLTSMKYLMDLNLVNNLIRDLSPLKELKSLQRLWIYMYDRGNTDPVRPAIMADLQAALPNCWINGWDTSTAGGWREHPRFQVLKRVFKTGQYEPFEDSPPENRPEGY